MRASLARSSHIEWACPGVMPVLAANERALVANGGWCGEQRLEHASLAELRKLVPGQGQRAHAVIMHTLGTSVVDSSSGILILEGFQLQLEDAFRKADGVRLDGHR